MTPMTLAYSTLAPITPADLDGITPDLDDATIDDLAFRLIGLPGVLLEVECARLAEVMLADMHALGYPMGRLEHLVVLALLRAAVARAASTVVGRA